MLVPVSPAISGSFSPPFARSNLPASRIISTGTSHASYAGQKQILTETETKRQTNRSKERDNEGETGRQTDRQADG